MYVLYCASASHADLIALTSSLPQLSLSELLLRSGTSMFGLMKARQNGNTTQRLILGMSHDI